MLLPPNVDDSHICSLDLLTFSLELLVVNWTLWHFKTTHMILNSLLTYFPTILAFQFLTDFANTETSELSNLRATLEWEVV